MRKLADDHFLVTVMRTSKTMLLGNGRATFIFDIMREIMTIETCMNSSAS